MHQAILALLLDSSFLCRQSYMRLSMTCQFAAQATRKRRRKYQGIFKVVNFMRKKQPSWQVYSRLWRFDGGVCTLPGSYWTPLLPMTPLEYALYFAIMMSLFGCQSEQWLSVLHPTTLCIKHLPSYHGYVFMHTDHGDISFPVFTKVVVDALLVSVRQDSETRMVDVAVQDYLAMEEPRVNVDQFRQRVDIAALSLFTRHVMHALRVDAVLDLVDMHGLQ